METTQQASEPPIKAPDFGEPWQPSDTWKDIALNSKGSFASESPAYRDRIIVCVNACAGMADPAREIQAMRDAIQEAATALSEILHSYDSEELTWVTRDVPANALAKLQPFLPKP